MIAPMQERFPADFVWGTATSAYQIEGGRFRDGNGDSIWDRFADSGAMPNTGDVTCDHFHRWREDVALMAELGVNAYRFSTAWTRILPDGDGAVNSEGLGFYDRLVDELLANGIAPWLTLYHWDLPQTLQDRGGWPERATVSAFERYADVVSKALGDRVKHWITQNEPWVTAHLGHRFGLFPPAIRDWDAALQAGHHLLLSHGRAAPIIRSNAAGAEVGISIDCRPSRPRSEAQEDVAANRVYDRLRNRWFLDPVFGKGYPNGVLEEVATKATMEALGRPEDHETIAAPIDFLGLNYYTSKVIGAGDEYGEDDDFPAGPRQPDRVTEMGWRQTPGALTEYLRLLADRYAPPQIVITENGASYSDAPGPDGIIHDQRRIAYLRDHLAATADALQGGVPVGGYFVWSLLDNLEWVHGYRQRFGIVWVDHRTGERIPKDSYRWYRAVATTGVLPR
jgi:beta-glucosidase